MRSCGRPSPTRLAARSSTSWSATARSAPAGWPGGCRSRARPFPSTWAGTNGARRSAGANRARRTDARGSPPCNPDMLARGSVAELIADLDSAGVERALVLPNYGVPDASVSFGFNPLVLEAAAADDRVRCGLWVSPRPQDAELNTAALALAGEQGVAALKTSFLLGGRADDPDCQVQLDRVFGTAREHGLVVHVHTSPGGTSDRNEVGLLVHDAPDDVNSHRAR